MTTEPYGIEKNIGDVPFEQAVERVTAALKDEGFGVLVNLDFKALLKEKLDIEFRPYVMLGACNPPLAYDVLQAEKNIGLLLPCPVIVQQEGDGTVSVAVGDPEVFGGLTGNPAIAPTMTEVTSRLKRVLTALV